MLLKDLTCTLSVEFQSPVLDAENGKIIVIGQGHVVFPDGTTRDFPIAFDITGQAAGDSSRPMLEPVGSANP